MFHSCVASSIKSFSKQGPERNISFHVDPNLSISQYIFDMIQLQEVEQDLHHYTESRAKESKLALQI